MLFGESTADFSACGVYRYRLRRVWDAGRGMVLWVMLNPSTANATHNDPTVQRCINFAGRWGYGGIEVRNLYALRSTDPSSLNTHPAPIGPRNVLVPAEPFALYMAAWGVHGASREPEVANNFAEAGIQLHCLGITKDGHPRHPLYMRGDCTPLAWEPATANAP